MAVMHHPLLLLALLFRCSAAITVSTSAALRAAVAADTSETIFLGQDIHLSGTPLSIRGRENDLNLDGQNHKLSGDGKSRVLYINQTREGSVQLAFSRLTIADGAAGSEDGGGILQDDGATTLQSVLLEGCSTDANGGGVLLRNGSMLLETVSFADCSSGWGGGVNVWDGAADLKAVTFSNCSGANAGNEVYDYPGPLDCTAGCPELGTYLPGGVCDQAVQADCETFDATQEAWVSCPEPCSAACAACPVCQADYYNDEAGGLSQSCKQCPDGTHTNGSTPADHDSIDDCQ